MSLPHVPLPGRAPRPRWQQRIADRQRTLARSERMPGLAQAPPRQETRGACTGLALPVAFDDVPALPQGAIDAFCNAPGFRGFGNHGSVADYFRDVSAGRLDYGTLVAPCYRAQRPRSHYLDPGVPFGQRARELVLEAIRFHRAQGFDFGPLTVDEAGTVRATSLLYAGAVANTHGQGLWPHASSLPGRADVVLSPNPLPPGDPRAAQAREHGGFDDDTHTVLATLQRVLASSQQPAHAANARTIQFFRSGPSMRAQRARVGA